MIRKVLSYTGIKTLFRRCDSKSSETKQLSLIAKFGIFYLGLWFATPVLYAQPVTAKPLSANATLATTALSANLTQRKVVKSASGAEKFEDASTVKPGDIIEYRATYTNNSTRSVAQLKAQLPIPEGLEYIALSAKPGADTVKAATRDGIFSSEPLMRREKEKQVPVPYSEYRQMQWTLGVLPANGVAVVSARARVETVIPVVPVKSPVNKRVP
jgi:uncharacterized repeat protein (TIGR01451 family)